MIGSGIGSASSYHWLRRDMTEPRTSVLYIDGTPSIVRSSISRRSVSQSGARSSSFQTRSHSGMKHSGAGMSQIPIFVTIPKFDCMKSWSGVGPRPRL